MYIYIECVVTEKNEICFVANSSSLYVKLNLVDLNRQAKMYSQGMAPVFKVVPGRPQWERIRDKPVYKVSFINLNILFNLFWSV